MLPQALSESFGLLMFAAILVLLMAGTLEDQRYGLRVMRELAA